MNRKLTAFLLACFAAFFFVGCGNTETASSPKKNSTETQPSVELISVRLALNWFPEAEHGGFYEAVVKGYYRELGLDVRILSGGPNAPVLQKVSGGTVQFGVSTADRVLLGRAQEVDVVAVMSPFQESPRCIIVHKKSGITQFEDLQNLTLAISPGGTFSQYLQKKLPLDGVKIVPYPGNVSQFLLDENYAQQAYVFSEPFVAEKEGGDPYSLMAADLGYNPYTSILITTSNTISENPELVQKMVAASIRGWQSYLENSDETNKHINGLNPEMGLDILDYGVKALKPLCITEAVPIEKLGLMTAERWQELANQLVEAEAIDAGAVDPATAFTVQFLNDK